MTRPNWQRKLRRSPILIILLFFLAVIITPVVAQVKTPNLIEPSQQEVLQLFEQGDRLYHSGQFGKATQVWQKAAVTFASQGNSLNQAMALSNLSLAYQKLYKWQQAEAAINNSLNILRNLENKPEKQRILAQSLDIQGRLQQQIGRSQEALEAWREAEQIYRQTGDRHNLVSNQVNQAQAYQDLGFYPRSCQTLLSALQVDSQQCEISTPQLQQLKQQFLENQSQPIIKARIRGLRSLGNVLRTIGNLQQSQQVLQLSLETAQKWHSLEDESKAWLNLGNTQQALGIRVAELGDWQQASTYNDQALISYQTASLIAPSQTVKLQAQLNQFKLFIEQEKWLEASKLSSSISNLLPDLPPTRLSTFTQIDFARNLICLRSENPHCLRQQLKEDRPLSLSQEKQSYLEITNLLTTAIDRAQQLGDKRTQSYALGILGQLAEHLHQWQQAETYTEEALNLAQQIEALDLVYQWQWQTGRLLKTRDTPEKALSAYRQAVATLQTLRTDLVTINPEVQFTFRESIEPIYREYVDLLLSSTKKAQPNQTILQQAIEAIDALQLAELENFFQLVCLDTQPVSLNLVTDKNDPSAAIIYPILLADRWEIILKLPYQPLRRYTTAIDNQAKTERILARLAQSLTQRNSQETLFLAQQVYNWLLRQAEPDLAQSKINNLVFILDSSLRNVPMAVLHDGRQYLIEKYSIALTPSLQLLDPQPLERQELTALTAGLTEARGGFPPLKFVADELAQVQSQVSSVKLIDREFTSNSLQNQINNNSLPIVHLATHGQFSSQAAETFVLTWDDRLNVNRLNDLLRSSQVATTGSIELLVLSACETLTGDRRAALGLAGVAVRAGARSTLATLWSVNDEATALLMGQFYQALNNPTLTKAESLRRAQTALLNNPRFERPHFWASYVLVGNWL
ncbi:MAG: CHAT domain-containing protein [Waterburya sp.]